MDKYMQEADSRTSGNFTIGKVIAILTVVGAHFLPIPNDWIAATIALFVFAFSSGYFTSVRYGNEFHLIHFWQRKLSRLGPGLLVVHLFLLGLFLVQGKSGIWTWQSLTSLFGVKGFINWFGLNNPTPFGAGLWFLTLLLIFYLMYPGLRAIGRSRLALTVLTIASLGACILLNRYVTMGHSLWLTAWGFIFGIFVQRLKPSVPATFSGVSAIGLAVILLVANVFLSFKHANFLLILAICIMTVLWLRDARMPKTLLSPLQLLSGCLLEIYLLHIYLFVHPTGLSAVDFVISLACSIGISLVLAHLAGRLRALLPLGYSRVAAATPGDR